MIGFLEPAIEGDSIQLTPENQKEGASNTLYGELKVTAVINGGASTRYEVDFDFEIEVLSTPKVISFITALVRATLM